MIAVQNHISQKVSLGIITARNIKSGERPARFESLLTSAIEKRHQPLSEQDDLFRKACRDMLRIGSYKPTGRGKPASEYLLRAALEDSFPSINPVADINNYISLNRLIPISLWDLDKIAAESWLFRPGKEKEEFIFNASGQTIGLADLVTGFALTDGQEVPVDTTVKEVPVDEAAAWQNPIEGTILHNTTVKEIPVVTPVKDCQLTKTDDRTRNIAVALYYPADWKGEPGLHEIIDEFSELLSEISETVESRII